VASGAGRSPPSGHEVTGNRGAGRETGRGVWACDLGGYIITIGGVIVRRCFVRFGIVVALAMSRLGGRPRTGR